jgi:chemotaxis protein methyltransferase CheR
MKPAHRYEEYPAVQLEQAQFEWLRDTIAEYAGIYLDNGQQRVLEQALSQRLALLGFSIERYIALIEIPDGRSELYWLAELLLNHETFFFRNRPQVRALKQVLLPELHQRKPVGQPLRIWSAGCATGEEPYSLAILALEQFGFPPIRPIEIIATDLSLLALKRANEGMYRGRTLQYVEPPLLQRYFERHGNSYRIGQSVRQIVQFQQLNLVEPFPEFLQQVDMIFCQNVTIYFQDHERRRLIERFHGLLHPNGLLFLGFSETLWNISDRFRSREVSGAYVYYKESQDRPSQRLPTTQPAPVQRPRRGEARQRLVKPAPAPVVAAPVSSAPLDLATARAYADQGQLEAAGEVALQILEQNPLHDEAYLLLGIVHSRQGQWKIAIQQFERARYLKPEAALISFHLASAYAEVGMFEHSRREYTSTLWKLRDMADDNMIEEVAVGWLRQTCQQQIERLERLRQR